MADIHPPRQSAVQPIERIGNPSGQRNQRGSSNDHRKTRERCDDLGRHGAHQS